MLQNIGIQLEREEKYGIKREENTLKKREERGCYRNIYMTSEKFNEIVNTRVSKCRTILGLKAQEYAPADRLSNFRQAGLILKTSKEKALAGMAVKHLVSLLEIVDELDNKTPPQAQWDEKVGDLINYLLLLDACYYERVEEIND